SGTSLLAAEAEALDVALWTAFRALEETAALRRKLASRMRTRGRLAAAERFERQATSADESAVVIRQVLLHGPSSGAADGDGAENTTLTDGTRG
ncbi:MAG TPA: chemotaxis protein CheB, partial [Dehalococcoidia bacterium]